VNINFEQAARYCFLTMLVCLSFATAVANLALVGFLLCALLSRSLWRELLKVLQTSIAQVSLGIFVFLILSVIWSEADKSMAWQWVSKYKKLLLIPLAAPFFYEPEHKLLILKGLFVSLLLGLSVSYLNFFGLTSIGDCPSMGCTMRNYITLSVLNCLLFIMSCVFSYATKTQSHRVFFLFVAIASAVNVAWVLPSRTGQLLLLTLIVSLPTAVWLFDRHAGRRNIYLALLGTLAIVSIFCAAIFLNQGSRLGDSLKKISVHKEESFTSTESGVSVDVRFEFYRKALRLIEQRPLLGWGAGGQEPEFKRLSEQGVTANERFLFANPHNEYLTWAVQTGLLGLACFLCWLLIVWKQALRIEDPSHKLIMMGWLLVFTLGSFLNSFLLDFSEGYMTVLLIAVLMPFQSNKLSTETLTVPTLKR
jgi:O-antigen ligase